jgi:putative transposase
MINRLHGRSGHLWQGRFYSSPLDNVHLWRALAYVERNPVRARLVRRAWRWPWSSAAAHAGKGADASDAAGSEGLAAGVDADAVGEAAAGAGG